MNCCCEAWSHLAQSPANRLIQQSMVKTFTRALYHAGTMAQCGGGQMVGKLRKHEPFVALVAVSGGRIANDFFSAVAAERVKKRWHSLDPRHFFWADERCVPPDHDDSNYPARSRHLLWAGCRSCRRNIHRIRGEDDPPEVAIRALRMNCCKVAPLNSAATPVLDLFFSAWAKMATWRRFSRGGAPKPTGFIST